MKKRLFAGLLTLVMIMSLVPMPALAVEDDTVVVPCTKTEGCILADGHGGDCVLSDEPEDGDSNGYYEFEDVTDEEGGIMLLGAGDDEETPALMSGSCGATTDDTVTWALTDDDNDGKYTLTISGTGAMADYDSPASTDENAVIAPWYTSYGDAITEVMISEGVTSIGNNAFRSLTALEKVNIPASIKNLGDHIFRGDTALTTVEWADGFTAPTITDTDSNADTYTGAYVPTSMFDGCTSLGAGVELTEWLPSSFIGVGCAAFRGTAFSVDFDSWENLSYIGAYGFASMPNLTTVTVKGSWTCGLRGNTQTWSAFQGSGLTSATIGDGVEEILFGTFQGCAQLTSVTLSDSVKTIDQNAFLGTSSLSTIDLKGVETIIGYAFQDSGLTGELILPENVTSVNSRAFEGCTNLTSLTINATNLTSFGANSFAGCSSLTTVTVGESASISNFSAGVFGPDTSANYLKYTQSLVATAEINGTVTTLNFSTLTALTDLTIDGKNASSIKSDRLPSSLENLTITGDSWTPGGYSFSKNSPPKNLIVTSKVLAGNNTEASFRSNTNLTTAQFTGSSVALQSKMFMGCTELGWLDFSQVESLTFGQNCFGKETNSGYINGSGEFNSDCVIYVKNGTDAAAARATGNTGTGLGTNGIVLIVNGGAVDTTAETAGFAAVKKTDSIAAWYEYDSSITDDSSYSEKNAVTTAEAGKTYIAVWEPCNHTTKAYTAQDNVLTETCADCGHVFGTATITAPTNLTYDGTEKAATVTTSDEWTGATLTPVYYNGNTRLTSAPTDAGTYTAKIAVGEGDAEVTASVEFEITKAKPTISISADNTSLTGGGTVTLTVDKSDLPDNAEVTVTCNNTSYNPTSGTDGKYTVTLPNSNGTYKFTVNYTGDTNHESASKDCTVSVTRYTSGGGGGTTTYTVTVDSAKNGTVSVSPKNASKGTTVTVTVKPNSGYELDDLTVTDKNGDTVKLTRKNDTQYTFTMPASKVTVEAAFAKIEEQPSVTFIDVPTSTYYYDAVEWAVENGITNGTSATTFSPDATCTRAQTVTFLWRAAGSPAPKSSVNPFTDVQPGAYYYEAVLWAVENGITNGTSATTFSPDDTVTRGQTVTFQHRAAGSPAVGGGSFADVAADAYYAPAVQWAVANGITNGTSSTTFSPDAPCTRGQIVTFLYRDMAE